MERRIVTRNLLGAILLCVSNLVIGIEGIPIPPQTEATWISKNSIHNGYETAIQKFKSRNSVGAILDFYRTEWEATEQIPPYVESEHGDWKLISRIDGLHQFVVQVKSISNRAGSEGFISSMSLEPTGNNGKSQRDSLVPELPGGEILSVTESDIPTRAITQVHLFTGRAQTIAQRIRKTILKNGWELQNEYDYKQSVSQRYSRAGRQLDIAAVNIDAGKSLLFLNEILHEKD